jgi:hypothetical protein
MASSLPDASAEAIRGGRVGNCVSHSGSGATAVSVFKHSPRLSLIEPEQAKRPHKVLNRSDLHLVNDTGHMVTYAGLFSHRQIAQQLAWSAASFRTLAARTGARTGHPSFMPSMGT